MLSGFSHLLPATPAVLRTVLTTMAMAASLAVTASAQSDRVYLVDGKNVSGKITASKPDGVQIRKGGGTQTILVDQIVRIAFEGTPSALTQAVQFYQDSQYQSAIDELDKIDVSKLKSAELKAEVDFYKAASKANLAVAGRGARDQATNALNQFVSKNRNSYHLYAAAELLGNLALVSGGDAARFYSPLLRAASDIVKRRGAYLTSLAKAKSGSHDEALKGYDFVLAAQATTPQMTQLQSLAKAAKAESLSAQGSHDEAMEIINGLISELDPNSPDINGKIYNALGAIHQAKGDHDGALLAYLRTHLMFASDPTTHARALTELVDLWTKVGRADRSATTRSLLKQLYPGF